MLQLLWVTPSLGAMVTSPAGLDKRLARAKSPTSWQRRLDKALLDVDKTPKQRARLLRKVAEDGEQIASDVRDAIDEVREKGMGKGHPLVLDLLFPTGSTIRGDLEGLAALRKQVPEALKELELKPPTTSSVSPKPPDLLAVASQLAALATDEKKQKELQEEAKNALRRTPKGLETPRYKTVRSWPAGSGALDGVVELRQYEPFMVAKRTMASGGLTAPSDSGAGFNALASYLFGANEGGEQMAMTMPVEIARADGATDGGATMSFVLPRAQADAPPAPNADDVRIEAVGAKLVCAKAFSGLPTEEEVQRQRTLLLGAIEADGGVVPLDIDAFSVLQYNSPLTVPWRRRNELAVVVVEQGAAEEEEEEEAAAAAAAAEVGVDGVVSWYDSGMRL